jgi:hypothetical protein
MRSSLFSDTLYQQAEVTVFVNALTDPSSNLQQFTAMLRDFLVSLKEFSSQVAASCLLACLVVC